jgi:hypothetical protein
MLLNRLMPCYARGNKTSDSDPVGEIAYAEPGLTNPELAIIKQDVHVFDERLPR